MGGLRVDKRNTQLKKKKVWPYVDNLSFGEARKKDIQDLVPFRIKAFFLKVN